MNFKYVSLFLLLFFGVGLHLSAQRNCNSMEYLEMQEQQEPKRALKLKQIDQATTAIIANNTAVMADLITIPVVVHVVYRTSTENISDAQIQSQIDVLNADFRRLNSDADNTWSQAADTDIEFCLASIDPNGNATNGITRTSTTVNGFGTNDGMKFTSQGGKDAWPANQYMNFWVCNIGGGILGYAQFPGGSTATDGVVCGYQYFGTTGTATAPFNLGRTATHEVGHWLNLRHIWGDGGCNVDDFVADTPTSDAANYGCATGHSSCSSTDMVQNYMDYSDDACMNLFTQGQTDRMRAIFQTDNVKAGLLTSPACGAPAAPTCDDGIQNQGETGVDCGGPCPGACPTCNDGIQNQGETGVDCGGPNCDVCPCTDNGVTLSITLDNYPEETSWTLTDASGTEIASGGTYANQPDGSTVSENFCLVDGCYDFTISDAYGDGICCSYGNGSYSVTDANGAVLASGGSFATGETTNICVGGGTGPDPTCNDGIQNQGETGIDCGGPCDACPTCNDGIQNQGETGIDCGGPCDACPTCNDGVQNGNETGVDCGGDCDACATCNDGIQNQGEAGVDCGGPCDACPTCNDGIQNQGETGVDCGGPNCQDCISCNDGVQNGNETGVDCGGPDCQPCNTGGNCTDTEITVTINLDNYPEETSWSIVDANGNEVASGGTYGGQADNSTVTETACLVDGCYDFVINDAYGDGICCGYGNGSYDVSSASATYANGGQFGSSESTSFCIGGTTAPTCNDGIQNQGETGVDCGGPNCDPCNTGGNCTYEIVDENNFDSSWGIWNDGGSDCRRSTNDAAYAYSGNRCVRLRDNTSTSTTTTDNMNWTIYDEVTVNFTYVARSMDNANEDFWLQISTNGGSSYTTVEEWNRGDEFENDIREFDGVTIAGPFSANTRLRFRCDASGNSDWVYLDDVVIEGCYNGQLINDDEEETAAAETTRQPQATIVETTLTLENMELFPNPVNDRMTVKFTASKDAAVQLMITDMTGKMVHQQQLEAFAGKQTTEVNAGELSQGIYFLHMITEDGKMTKKFVVVR